MNKLIHCDRFRDDRVISGALQQRPASLRQNSERGIVKKNGLAPYENEIWAYSTPLSRAASGGSANSDEAPWEKLQNLAQLSYVTFVTQKTRRQHRAQRYKSPGLLFIPCKTIMASTRFRSTTFK